MSQPDAASWKLQTDSPETQALRLHLTSVPGWHATIDGKPLALSRYENVMMQARIPPGHHVIELHYWPTTFTLGIVLAVLAVLALVAGILIERYRPGLFASRRRGASAT